MNKNPIITPYRSIETLLDLRDKFYNFEEKDQRREAIELCESLSIRGKLTHLIDSTSLLTACILDDNESSTSRLSYSMALIKFVNGILDPLQKASYAIPLYMLASKINLPSLFVEIRHISTHETLPSLELLRECCLKALNWIYDHYWGQIEQNEAEDNEDEYAELKQEIKVNLKEYRKIKKLDLNKIWKFGDSSEMGLKYWKSINLLRKNYTTNDGVFLEILVKEKNFLNTRFRVYRDLIAELKELREVLIVELIGKNDSTYKSWIEKLIDNYYMNSTSEIQESIINKLSESNNELNLGLLKYLQVKTVDNVLNEKVNKLINLMERTSIVEVPLKMKKVSSSDEEDSKRPLMPDISDLESLRKRMRVVKSVEVKLFETYKEWDSLPFGVCE